MNAGYKRDIAHQIITRAIKSGKLQRPAACATCNVGCKPYAHHENDDLPLQVEWLCSKCHASRHIQLRRRLDIMPIAVRKAKQIMNALA